MEPIIYKDHEQAILVAIRAMLKEKPLERENNEFNVVSGFFNQPLQSQLDGWVYRPSRTTPMVALVGEKTGQVYFYALTSLLPDIDIG